MSRSTSAPVVSLCGYTVESDSNRNLTVLLPGEEASVTVGLKNFDLDALSVQGTLSTDDPYVTLINDQVDYGEILEGAIVYNDENCFTLMVDETAPLRHEVDLTLTATYAGGATVSSFRLCVSKFDYLVWDPTVFQFSGPQIHNNLRVNDYWGHCSATLPINALEQYFAVFVSCGVRGDSYQIPADSPEALALEDFLLNHGSLLIEGGDVWHHEVPLGGHDFRPLFGILPGDSGVNSLTRVQGVEQTFSDEMDFRYSWVANYMDALEPNLGGREIFFNSIPDYCIGMVFGIGFNKSIALSLEIGGLVDGEMPSIKRHLIQLLMERMTPFHPAGVNDDSFPPAGLELILAGPNPFVDQTAFRFSLAHETDVQIDLFDPAGRKVRDLFSGSASAGSHQVAIDGNDLDTGIYFIQSSAGEEKIARKCILVR